jgi:hypothetical protein
MAMAWEDQRGEESNSAGPQEERAPHAHDLKHGVSAAEPGDPQPNRITPCLARAGAKIEHRTPVQGQARLAILT